MGSGWIDESMVLMDGWMDGWMNEWTGGWINVDIADSMPLLWTWYDKWAQQHPKIISQNER